MNPEKASIWHREKFRPASEQELDIPSRLRHLHETEGKFLTQGVFFDVYAIDLPDKFGNAEPFVFKDFRSGDVIMSPEEQVSLFQHQFYEWHSLRKKVGHEFFPESYWIRSHEFSDDEAHGFYAIPGKTANTMQEFVKIQLDRQLTNRYSTDDKKLGAVKKFMHVLGKTIAPQHTEKPFIGAIVQQRIHGIPFSEAFKQLDKNTPSYQTLRANVQRLIRGLRQYHDTNSYGAFTWHGLESDNVMTEIDHGGNLTGKIYIIDANFTERPNKVFKEKVTATLEQNVLKKLEDFFGL